MNLLKKSYLILLTGAALLLIGLGTLWATSATVEEKLPTTSLIIEGVRIMPSESYSVEVELAQVDQLFLGATGIPREEPLMVSIEKVDLGPILEEAFNASVVEDLGALDAGDYLISVTNLGEQPVVVYAALTTEPILDEIDQLASIAMYVIVGMLLFLIGIAVTIAGGVVYLIQRKRTQ